MGARWFLAIRLFYLPKRVHLSSTELICKVPFEDCSMYIIAVVVADAVLFLVFGCVYENQIDVVNFCIED